MAALAVAVTAWLGLRRSGLLTGERSVGSTDEDADAFGSIAVVVARLEANGVRISFRGTTWPAQLVRGEAEVGAKVRIVDRDNLIWIVEPVSPA